MEHKNELFALILAGGMGTRMKSELPKVLHPAAGIPIIAHILKAADSLSPKEMGVIVGHKAEVTEKAVSEGLAAWGISSKVKTFTQTELTGSGRAVQEAMPHMKGYCDVLVLCGDTPLITGALLKDFYQAYKKSGADAAVLTAKVPNPYGYGRILKNSKNLIDGIIEQTETNKETAEIAEINSGMYIFSMKALASVIGGLKPNGPKKEYYLTDAIKLMADGGLKTFACAAKEWTFILGVNSRVQLAEAEKMLRARKIAELQMDGVTIQDPATTYIDDSVKIGRDTVILAGTHIYGNTEIGRDCKIGPACVIENCSIGDGTEVKFSCVLNESEIMKNCAIGPFSHIRPNCVLSDGARVGNFSELKKAKIGAGSKVNHLSYVGDTEMGEGVNVGAGTITCNYDGVRKHKTIIGNNVFIGSNTNLVAPVTVANGSHIAAGSTITDDIPAGSLAIARARQVVKEGRYPKGT
ncbi:MAG: bifunctional UDP-N-acetylglucosamine diphosphorylase/glucosamine-1-phosphate N-acetyltransferase GlmU [Elusimicrobiaceae bacterium]